MKKVIFFLCALALVASAGYADVPDPSKCTTTLDGPQRILLVPWDLDDPAHPQSSFTVTVRNAANNVIVGAVVQVLIGGQAGSYTELCPDAVTEGTTNAQGVVEFNIAGGGCYKGDPNAAVIRGNGVDIRNWAAVMSPDYGASDNAGIPDNWSLSLTLGDWVGLSGAFANPPPSCHDYDNSGVHGVGDVSVFSQTFPVADGRRDCID